MLDWPRVSDGLGPTTREPHRPRIGAARSPSAAVPPRGPAMRGWSDRPARSAVRLGRGRSRRRMTTLPAGQRRDSRTPRLGDRAIDREGPLARPGRGPRPSPGRPRPPARASRPTAVGRGATAETTRGRKVLGRSLTIRQAAIESRSIARMNREAARAHLRRASVKCQGTFRRRRPAARANEADCRSRNVDPSDDRECRRREVVAGGSAVAARRGAGRGGAWSRGPWPSSLATASGPGRRGQAPKGTGGMPRRRRQAGRGRLRKARGRGRTPVDPEVPRCDPGN